MRCTPPEKVVERWNNRALAAIVFMYFVLADCPRIAVENPVGYMSRAYRKPDQIIEPYMFANSMDNAEEYVTKRTCLWLKGLPTLERTNNFQRPNNKEIYGIFQTGKAKTWEDSALFGNDRAKLRSKTFPGIAKAMAEQWG